MKKFFTLLALVCLSCIGAWAQTTHYVKGAAISAQTDLKNGDLVILGVKSHGNKNEAHLMYAASDAAHPFYRTNYRAHRDAHEFYENNHVWKVANVNTSTNPATFQLQSLANEAALLPNGEGFNNGSAAANIYLQAVTAYNITEATRDNTPRFAIRFTNYSNSSHDTYHFNAAIGGTTDSSSDNAQIGFWGAPQNPNSAGTETFAAFAFYKAETITYSNVITPTYVATNGATGDEGAAKMVDGNVETKWGQGTLSSGPYYVILKAGESPVCVKGYSLWNGNDTFTYQGRRATAWKLQGSDSQDGEWHDIDVRSNEVQLPENKKPNTYKADNSESYLYYKLTIDAVDGRGEHADMFQFSEFKLYITPDWAGLEAIIAEAATYPYGDHVGEYSNPVFGSAKLEAEQLLAYHEGGLEASVAAVEEAIASLRTAIDNLTLNMPAAGKFYRFKGYTNSKYMEHKENGMKLNSTTQGTKESIVLLQDAGEGKFKLLFYVSGQYAKAHGIGSIGEYDTYSFGQMMANATTPCIGQYYLKSTEEGKWEQPWNNGTVQNKGTANDDASQYDTYGGWILEEVTELPVTLPTSGITTFYAPVAMQVNGDVNVYVGAIDDGETTITYTKLADKKIPAGTGVLIKGTASGSITISPIDEEVAELSSIILGKEYTTACSNPMTIEGQSKYIYTLSSGVFQYYTGSTLAGFKGHLELTRDHRESTGNSPLRVVFVDDFTTGIETVESNVKNEIFDLQGRRVNNAQKGLYIINGRKVIR